VTYPTAVTLHGFRQMWSEPNPLCVRQTSPAPWPCQRPETREDTRFRLRGPSPVRLASSTAQQTRSRLSSGAVGQPRL
jgi:hypothetical protein